MPSVRSSRFIKANTHFIKVIPKAEIQRQKSNIVCIIAFWSSCYWHLGRIHQITMCLLHTLFCNPWFLTLYSILFTSCMHLCLYSPPLFTSSCMPIFFRPHIQARENSIYFPIFFTFSHPYIAPYSLVSPDLSSTQFILIERKEKEIGMNSNQILTTL